ncbi:MAG: D-aminoacylase [Pseudomonadota bacterium]
MRKCDLLIKGGTVIDGTGAPGFLADVAVDGGRICAVGQLCEFRAGHVIEATGQVVAPGFIDVHTHDDWAVLQTPDMACKITQGVTTVIAGNCGISAAPFRFQSGLPAPFNVVPGMEIADFSTVELYENAVNQAKPAVNVMLLAGHSALRAQVMGTDLDRPASEAEIGQMAQVLDQALAQGACGLSSGLDYPAAFAAPTKEMTRLARVVSHHPGRVYTTHMRDEGDGVVASVREALETGKSSGARLVISHHKCAGQANFGKSIETLGMIDAARETQDIGFDVYPYVASSTALIERFLPSAKEIKVIWSDAHPEQGGRMLDDIAEDWSVDRSEAARRLHPAGAIYFDMDEGDLQRIMAHPLAMIGSDGLPGTQKPHPRLWGTFPRVLGRYVRELNLLSLAQAIHKMTGLSADTFGIKDRGFVRDGYVADLVIFDPHSVLDKADYDDPEVPSAGINHVFVAGEEAMKDGMPTSSRAGQFLKG